MFFSRGNFAVGAGYKPAPTTVDRYAWLKTPHSMLHTLLHLCRIFAGIGENALIRQGLLTVFLYRKTKSPIYIYTGLCYYVCGEDWEL